MPRYSWDIKDLVFEEDVRKMYDKADNRAEAFLLSLLWVAGPRPAEIKELKKESFRISEGQLSIVISTKKLGKDGKFKVKERTLDFPRTHGVDSNLYIETIIQFAQGVQPDTFVLDYTTRWQEDTINDISTKAIGKRLCPYHLRHSVMTWLARNRATVEQIAHFKGGTVASALQYLHAVPYVVQLENLRRTRAMSGQAIGAAPAPPSASPTIESPPQSSEPPASQEPAVPPASPAQPAQSEAKPAEPAPMESICANCGHGVILENGAWTHRARCSSSECAINTKAHGNGWCGCKNPQPASAPQIETKAVDPDFASETPNLCCRWCGKRKSECDAAPSGCCGECAASGRQGHDSSGA